MKNNCFKKIEILEIILGVVLLTITVIGVDLYRIERDRIIKHNEVLIAIDYAALAEREKKIETEYFRELTQEELLGLDLNSTQDLNLTVVKGLPNEASK